MKPSRTVSRARSLQQRLYFPVVDTGFATSLICYLVPVLGCVTIVLLHARLRFDCAQAAREGLGVPASFKPLLKCATGAAIVFTMLWLPFCDYSTTWPNCGPGFAAGMYTLALHANSVAFSSCCAAFLSC